MSYWSGILIDRVRKNPPPRKICGAKSIAACNIVLNLLIPVYYTHLTLPTNILV